MRCHRKSNQAMSPEVAGCLRSTLAAVPFKAATQHPGSSSPPSLLRWGCCSRMCIASFSSSSLLVLAWSITVASSHLIGWWFSLTLAYLRPEEGQSIWPKRRQGFQPCFGKVFNPVLKLVFENYPFSCLSQLRSPHFIYLSISIYIYMCVCVCV